MIAKELEECLHQAFVDARQERYQHITVEHLLLALLDAPSAASLLRGCGANMTRLRNALAQQIVRNAPTVEPGKEVDTQPTLGFQRVIQRAILRVQSSGGNEVTPAEVLVAILGEKDSHAVRILADQDITRFHAVFHLAHGVSPAAPSHEAPPPEGAELQVVLYNDSYTPMQFVVDVLQNFFSMNVDDAKETMLEVHREGVAVCGLFERQAALELVERVREQARQHGHPLNCAVRAPTA
jgi:ATP-dependent Clp protease adapter protein ClpS